MENYASFLENRFLQIKKRNNEERRIESLVDFFAVFPVQPETAFSLKVNVNLKSKIYDLLNQKGYQTVQYLDIRSYLLMLDSYDYLTYTSLQDIFLELNDTLVGGSLTALRTADRIERSVKLQPLVLYLKQTNERLLKHVEVMLRIYRQGVLTNKQLGQFLQNKSRLEVSLLRFLIPLELCLYKLVKGFNLVQKTGRSNFNPKNPTSFKIFSKYFVVFFAKLAEVREKFGDASELFNAKEILAGAIEGDIRKSLALLDQLIPTSVAALQKAAEFSCQLHNLFQQNEVRSPENCVQFHLQTAQHP